MQEKIRKKLLNNWRSRTWFLHYDNAPAHSALLIHEFWLIKKYLWSHTLPILLIWPRVIIFLSLILKFAVIGQRFRDVEEIKANTATELKAITLEQFQRTSKRWRDRWNHCISSGGQYFEGDIFK